MDLLTPFLPGGSRYGVLGFLANGDGCSHRLRPILSGSIARREDLRRWFSEEDIYGLRMPDTPENARRLTRWADHLNARYVGVRRVHRENGMLVVHQDFAAASVKPLPRLRPARNARPTIQRVGRGPRRLRCIRPRGAGRPAGGRARTVRGDSGDDDLADPDPAVQAGAVA